MSPLVGVRAMSENGTYGSRFKACRQAIGLTQTELAVKVALTRSSIANIEAGRQRSLIDDVVTFAEVLGVDPAWLAFGRITVDGPPPAPPQLVKPADLLAIADDLKKAAARVAKLAAVAQRRDPLGTEVVAP